MSGLTHYFTPIIDIVSDGWGEGDQHKQTIGSDFENLLDCVEYLSQQRKINKKKYHKTWAWDSENVIRLEYEIVEYVDDEKHGLYIKNRCGIYLDEVVEDETDWNGDRKIVKVKCTMSKKQILTQFKVAKTEQA